MTNAGRVVLGAAALWVAADAAGLLGPLSTLTFLLLGTVCVVATVRAIRWNGPGRRWPWQTITCALFLFLGAGAARQALGTLGDLSTHRSLVPDALAMPGYVLAGLGLTGLARARTRGSGRSAEILLDGMVAGLAAFALAWVYLVSGAVLHSGAPVTVRMVLGAYPALSVVLVAVTARLAFTSGRRSPAHRALIATMVCMLIGDIVYMLADTRRINPPQGVLDLPYALAWIGFTACMLSPSMRAMSEPVDPQDLATTRGRIVVVGIAFSVPGIIVATRHGAVGTDDLVLAAVVLLLTAAGVWRLLRLMRAQRRFERDLTHQATHDELTGLPNRAYAEQVLSTALAGASPSAAAALLFLDLDRFKLVNDTLGHSVGDELLQAVAGRLLAAVGRSDVVARVGGDEFLVLLRNVTSPADADARADRVLASLREPVHVRGSEIFATASIGLCLSEGADDRVTPEGMLRDADTAMYRAKDAGRDTVVTFDESMQRRAVERHVLERDVRHAFLRDELSVAYQPILSMPEGRITSVEALLRWNHPELGLVPPDRFVPIVEENGLIVDIGLWVLSEACAAVGRWRRSVPSAAGLEVAVNVSPRQLRDKSLPDAVGGVLRDNGLPASALSLELTESLLISGGTEVTDLLADLRQEGIALSIDDFGTGYSSLAYLKRFPVDRVKIDRAFVDGLDQADSADESLVAAIIAMARALGLRTIAEGVETEAQESRLRALGCDAVQGWRYAKALSEDQMLDVLLNGLPVGAAAAPATTRTMSAASCQSPWDTAGSRPLPSARVS